MRSFKHWTLTYAVERSLNLISNLAHPAWPWFTPAAVRFLERRLKAGHLVFEWGAGRSTLWLARRVQKILSVEHDPAWFEKIQSRAGRLALNNLELKLVPDGHGLAYASRYVNAVFELPDSFDLIVVDGIHRGPCAWGALSKVRPGGMILVDNANWYLPSPSHAPASRNAEQGPASPEWADFQQRVTDWFALWTSNGVTDTAIWIRPESSTHDSQAAASFLRPITEPDSGLKFL